MAFDFGAGVAAAGETVAKVAGSAALENVKSELEKEKIVLADSLATKRESVGRQEEHGLRMVQQKDTQVFQSAENVKTLASHEKVAQIGKEATLGSASLAAGASREHSAALERIENVRSETSKAVAEIQGTTRKEVADKNNATVLEKFGMTKLSDDAVDIAADQFIETGKTSSYGRSNGVVQVQIQEKVAQKLKAQGKTMEDIRPNWGTVKASELDLNNQIKLGSLLANYNQTLEKNIKALDDLKAGYGPSWSPLVNKWIQNGRQNLLGDKDVTALNYQLGLIAIEAAKLNTGQLGIAGLPEGAREKSQAILNEFKNPETIERVVQAIQADAYNRLSSQSEQIKNAQQGIRTGQTPDLATRPTDRRASPDNPKGYPTVPLLPNGGIDIPAIKKMNPGPLFLPGRGVRTWDGEDLK